MSSEEAGRLTPEIIRRSMDDLWNMPRREPRPPAELLLDDPFCKASLFEPDDSLRQALRLEIITWGVAVHPNEARWLDSPVQGPAPLRCARLPHPDSPWHWDGCGTWFR